MKQRLSVIIITTIILTNTYAQEIKVGFQKISMRGYNIEIPETWSATDNYDPEISDFRFITSYLANGTLEIFPLSGAQNNWSPEKILNVRLFFTDKQLIIRNAHKSRRYKPYEQVFAIQNNNDKNITGEIIIIENDGYKYVLMYYGNKRFCKSDRLKHALQSFTPVFVKEIDPDAGISDSIRAEIPQEIDMDNYAQTADGWYKYNNWGVQFEFPNVWTVFNDESKDGIRSFTANSIDGNEFITMTISPNIVVSEQMIDAKIEKKESSYETYYDKQIGKIDNLSTIDYRFLIKNEENTDLSPMHGEIRIFGDSLRQFYIVSVSDNSIATNQNFNRLFKSFKIKEDWLPEEDYFVKATNIGEGIKEDENIEKE